MSYTHNPLTAAVTANIYVPEDDIDTIFSQLQQIEPPKPLIARILAQIPMQSSPVSTFSPSLREPEMTLWATQTRQRNLC